jgi:transcriptional regulator with XRE-family HTH domain|tara:strand:+ start:1325 stop:1930 length:606 start_codon:yes stop_codon:yes gene_type:complete
MPASPHSLSNLNEQAQGLRVGRRLAQLRKSKGLTLAQISSITSISEATLSRAENELSSLNAHNLYILAKVLEVEVEAFFRTDAVSFSKGLRAVTKRGQGEKESTTRYDLELLCAELSAKKMVPSVNHVTAASVEEAGGPQHHDGEEFIYVLSGRVVIHTEFYRPTLLEEGDSMYFDSNMAHAYVAVDAEPSDILVVTTVER